MPVKVLLNIMSSKDIAECMAFDRLKDEEYREELQAQDMTPEEQSAALFKMLSRASN